MTDQDKKNCPCPVSACKKLLLVFAAALLIVAGLSYFVDAQAISEIKYNFSLWTIIALVVIINLVSGLCFLAMYMAYRWVQRDIKPSRDDEFENS